MKKASEPVAGSVVAGPILLATSARSSWATKCIGSPLLCLGQGELPSRGAAEPAPCAGPIFTCVSWAPRKEEGRKS